MRAYIIFTVVITSLLMVACSMVNIAGNPIQGLYSHYDATNAEYPGLLVKADSTAICDLEYPDSPKVFMVNGQQLKECLTGYDNAIVYIWDAHCPAEQCFSPSLLQKYCDEKNVQLFVVAEYYDGPELIQFYEIKRPLFGIDTKYYKADYIDKYRKLFEADLDAVDESYSRMLYFKKGKYVGGARIEFEEERKL